MQHTTPLRLLLIPLLATISAAITAAAAPLDSLRTTDIEEIVVVATPKENQRLRQQPLASSSFSQLDMLQRGVAGIKDLSAHVPNLFIPSYGSRLTTSMYIRGIGSRTGTPAVALYVDGVPQVSAASYDFSFSNVDRVDVLRGPQSTLYGRNSMGGVVRIYTKNPMHYQGTDIVVNGSCVAGRAPTGRSDGGSAGHYKLNLTHYHRVSDRFAFSAHFFGERDCGYFRNEARQEIINDKLINELIDEQTDGGARMRFVYKPKATLNFDLTIGHEWLRQGGYPYEYRGVVGTPTTPDPQTPVGHIAYDNHSGYRRNLTTAGLTTEKRWPRVMLTSTTGFQHLHDRMDLDQDFTDRNLYTLMQRQNQNTLSEEIIVKKSPTFMKVVGGGFDYSYLFGLNAMRQWSNTDGPVTFHDDGLSWLNGLVNGMANKYMPTVSSADYAMAFQFNNQILGSDLAFPGTYETPATNLALFHQSTLQNLFGARGLTLTTGLRLDYERLDLRYHASYGFDQSYALGGHLTYNDGVTAPKDLQLVQETRFRVDDALQGNLHDDYLQLLPRITLQWQPQFSPLSRLLSTLNYPLSTLYVSVSRGYRSGGYNNQMFSDLLQARMQARILQNVTDATLPVVREQPSMPDVAKATVEQILTSMSAEPETDVQAATWYKPESSWNYEAGAHLNFAPVRLTLDVAAFLTDTRDQQVSKMSAGGLGRVTVNSGKSRSYGAELSLNYLPTDQLQLTAAYGYTHARFRNSKLSTLNSQLLTSHVPFVPAHTLSVGATQTWPVRRTHLSAIRLHADYHGAGPIYWTDQSDIHQPFAGQLNARLTFQFETSKSSPSNPPSSTSHAPSPFSISLFATNILSTRYQTFYFETMQRGFAQYTRPVTLGVELRWQL